MIKLFGLGKHTQACLIATEDGRIVHEDLEVLKGCAANHQKMEAWALDATNQVRNKKTGIPTQIICERSPTPLPVRGIPNVKITEQNINAIAGETLAHAYIKIERDAIKNRYVTGIMLLIAMPCIGVLLVVAYNLWQQRGGL